MIRGQKGTAKSTAVRALADIEENIRVIELPINATEDRVQKKGTIRSRKKTQNIQVPNFLKVKLKTLILPQALGQPPALVIDTEKSIFSLGLAKKNRRHYECKIPKSFCVII